MKFDKDGQDKGMGASPFQEVDLTSGSGGARRQSCDTLKAQIAFDSIKGPPEPIGARKKSLSLDGESRLPRGATVLGSMRIAPEINKLSREEQDHTLRALVEDYSYSSLTTEVKGKGVMNTFIVTAVEKKTSSKANEQEKVAISVLKFSEIEKPHEYISQKSKRQRNSLLDKLNKTMNSSRFLSNLGNSVKSLKGLKSSRKTNSRTNVQPTEEEIRAMEAGNEWEKASTERVQSNRLSAIQRSEADNEVVRNRKLDNAAGVGELLKGDYFLQAGNRIQLSFHGS